MADLTFVRHEMVPEQAPPATSVGPRGWLRENLFSSPLNAILTLLSLGLIWWVLSHALPWIVLSSWTASSLGECREQIAAAHGEGTTGACWAVIRERYLQLLFGFYPSDLYWRPLLAFGLALLALAPVLFTALPRRLLWLSAAAPFVVPWLLWGGSVWVPVCVALGFGLGLAALRVVSAAAGGLAGVIAAGVVPVLWWLFLAWVAAGLLQAILPFGITPVESRAFGGFMLSITIGLVAITLSLPIGIVLALGRQSNLLIIKAICVGFIEFIRGVPLITLLFVASLLLNYFMPPGTNFDIILRVIIMVTLFASAYMAEVIRGGLAALPRGQYEAADALGLDYWKAQRLIVMPQALKISIPGIVSTFIGVFKDTTLVSIIGLLDPLGFSNSIRANAEWNGVVWELYGFIAALFFVFCFSMSRYSMYLERKLRTENR
ncbi:amino acid ABC transporter permease [Rhodovulum euryhalinum]|uniref:L-glutamine ABC transporter membrane protein /L-glutamate ABC transporter membrane protein /L-aspartate ABC transporter membrane protein /L-asparagine ABC transporter membrane protein n=1 Tax=Rhodovulum euryhalinum TaxID=35805 RepID=A0A4V2SAG1_9RHOB|nr:amino acid ABC transporter permease [Rhodovulum euryhalinum]TCO71530.1 L-glutamine ABC transporter membrane protein /L-glutamate ABC transporter membrane protein /L-aspartate ABC transporter membrane protein /L-asparagine ABC transporter membrane protein [Rhodovulum euryhalinum]